MCTNFADYDSLFELLVVSLDKHFGAIQNGEFPVTPGCLLRDEQTLHKRASI